MNCKNCGSQVDGKFCSECGQNKGIHPITVKNVVHDFIHALTHADKGFLLTLKKLLTLPGIVAKEYIEGKRKKYFNPLSFLVIIMAISTLANIESGYFKAFSERPAKPSTAQAEKREPSVKKVQPADTVQFADTLQSAKTVNPAAKKKPGMYERAMRETYKMIITKGKIIGLVLVTPLFAFLLWVFFRKPKYGYAEHFVLMCYMVGLMEFYRTVIFIPAHVLLPVNIHKIDYVFQSLFLIYLIIACRQFFHRNLVITILKSILILGLFIALFWVCILSYSFVKLTISDLLAGT